MWYVILLLVVSVYLLAWSLCRVSGEADRVAANAWMDSLIIEKPSDIYPPTMTKAEADEVSAQVWR